MYLVHSPRRHRGHSGLDSVTRQAPQSVGESRPFRPIGPVLWPQALDDRHIVRVIVADENFARLGAVGCGEEGEAERLKQVEPDAARGEGPPTWVSDSQL